MSEIMRRRKEAEFLDDDIALAMELRSEGCDWESIADVIGCNIREHVTKAKVLGMRKTRLTDKSYRGKTVLTAQ